VKIANLAEDITEMTVFELLATSAWHDWASRGSEVRIGLFSTLEKAQTKIDKMKQDKEWKMSWSSFRVVSVNVE
jgi:hypothetical protein